MKYKKGLLFMSDSLLSHAVYFHENGYKVAEGTCTSGHLE